MKMTFKRENNRLYTAEARKKQSLESKSRNTKLKM